MNRRRKPRPSRRTYCVVVEGQTEEHYFRGAKAEFDQRQHEDHRSSSKGQTVGRQPASLVVHNAGGISAENVFKEAIKCSKEGHAKVWCVVDADFYVSLQGSEKTKSANKMAVAIRKGVVIVFSRPCFEVWFRHHFNANTSAWNDGNAAKRNITGLWPAYADKRSDSWHILRDKLTFAIANASAVRALHLCPPNRVKDCNASTDVDSVLIELGFE